MGVPLQEAPVHVGAGIAFVGVADDVLGIALGLPRRIPLPAGGETSAAAAPEVCLDHLLDDRFGLHPREGLPQGAVAADGQVILQALGIDLAVLPEDQTGLLLVEGDVVLVDHLLTRGGIDVAEPVDDLALQDGLVDDLTGIRKPDPLVEDLLRGDDDHRAALAEPVTAGGAEIDLIGEIALGELLAEVVHQFLSPVGQTAGPDAYGDAGLLRVAAGLEPLLYAFQFIEGFNLGCHQSLPSSPTF